MLDGSRRQNARVGGIPAEGVLFALFMALAALLQHHFQIDRGKIIRFKRLPNLFKTPFHAIGRDNGIEGIFLLFPLLPGAQHTVAAKGEDDFLGSGEGKGKPGQQYSKHSPCRYQHEKPFFHWATESFPPAGCFPSGAWDKRFHHIGRSGRGESFCFFSPKTKIGV